MRVPKDKSSVDKYSLSHSTPLPSVPPFPQPACTHPAFQSRTRFCFHKKKLGCVWGGPYPFSGAGCAGIPQLCANSERAVRPRASSMNTCPLPLPRAQLLNLRPHHQQRRSPSRPGLSREGSQASPPPATTSFRTVSSTGANACNYQVQDWGQKGGQGEGRRAQRVALPRKLSAASSQPATVTNTKWRREESRRSDHHPPTKGARSGRP